MNQTKKRIVLSGALAVALAATGLLGFQAGVHAQAVPPAGRTVAGVLDNTVLSVNRITYQPGFKQEPHTANVDGLMVQITPGKMVGTIDGVTTTGGAPGTVWWAPKAPSLHAFSNADTQPISFLAIQLK